MLQELYNESPKSTLLNHSLLNNDTVKISVGVISYIRLPLNTAIVNHNVGHNE